RVLELARDLRLGDKPVPIVEVVYVFPIEALERHVPEKVPVHRWVHVTHGTTPKLVLDPQVMGRRQALALRFSGADLVPAFDRNRLDDTDRRQARAAPGLLRG